MRDDRGERKKYKIINRRATVTVHMHGYCSICHKCIFFTPTDVSVFLLKICKMSNFFYFARFYTY